jgi:hypothetical protein
VRKKYRNYLNAVYAEPERQSEYRLTVDLDIKFMHLNCQYTCSKLPEEINATIDVNGVGLLMLTVLFDILNRPFYFGVWTRNTYTWELFNFKHLTTFNRLSAYR